MTETSKRCSTCKAIRPFRDFSVSRRATDGRQSRCRDCWRAWYASHREQHIDQVARRNADARTAHQRRIALYLADHPCVDCGEADLQVLDFDHEDPASKSQDVARLASMNIAWERVAAEIAKCSVRCANCHRRRTAEMFGYWRATAERERLATTQAAAASRLEALVIR